MPSCWGQCRPHGLPVEIGSEHKKTRKTQGNAGFLGVGGREFESPTSTMSTWRSPKTPKPLECEMLEFIRFL